MQQGLKGIILATFTCPSFAISHSINDVQKPVYRSFSGLQSPRRSFSIKVLLFTPFKICWIFERMKAFNSPDVVPRFMGCQYRSQVSSAHTQRRNDVTKRRNDETMITWRNGTLKRRNDTTANHNPDKGTKRRSDVEAITGNDIRTIEIEDY